MAGLLFVGTLIRGCSRGSRMASANADVDVAVADRLAREASGHHEPGKIVFVRYSGFISSTEKVQKTQLDGFRRGLEAGSWDIIELPPADMEQGAHGGWALRTTTGDWGDDLVAWMSSHSDAVAIVSMVGVPHLSPNQWQALPPLYAQILFITDYENGLLQRGLVAGLAAMNEDGDPVKIRAFRGSPEELFDMAFDYLEPNAPRGL